MMMDSEKDFLSGADRFSVLLDNSDDEYVQIVLTDEYIDANNWMSANFTRILDHLQTTERPLAHIDAQPKNLFPGVREDGEPETIAIDCASPGYAALGMDVASLMASSLTWFEVDVSRAKQLQPLIFENYIEGLNEVAWSEDRDNVWLGYMTVAGRRAFNPPMFTATWINDPKWITWMETNLGQPAEELAIHWRAVFEWAFPKLKAAAERVGIV